MDFVKMSKIYAQKYSLTQAHAVLDQAAVRILKKICAKNEFSNHAERLWSVTKRSLYSAL